MNKTLRLGIIGTCSRGTLGDYAHDPEHGAAVVAGADPYDMQRNAFVERYKEKFHSAVKGYADYREMIEKEQLDGVFVTAPDHLHEEMAVFALNHKVAVYLEKPIAITIEGADRILRAACDSRTPLLLGHNMRYMNFTNQMKDLIDSGVIGEVKAVWCRHFISYGGDAYFRDWHANTKYTTSLLLQKGAHDIDIIHWLAGSHTHRVHGFGTMAMYDRLPRRPKGQEHLPGLTIGEVWGEKHWPPEEQTEFYPDIDNEDINMVQMQLLNGVQACYVQCHFTPDVCRNYTVIGSKGRLENYGDGDDATVQVWTRRCDRFRLEGDITCRMPPSAGSHGGADPKIVGSFVKMLQGDPSEVKSTPQAARYSVACGVLGAESIRSGGAPKTVPELPAELENYDFSTRGK
ncbi:MAG: Gfo/Idh/MocA family oxidoreductase [Victivallaceae bacterium]|nr:Gfo/Idh/MocA family oxidoreductase [Victivallaceae bacterium]